MSRRKARSRILSAALSVMLLLGTMTGMAMAQGNNAAGAGGEITAFAPLPEETAYQSVALGSSRSALDLPDALEATVEADMAPSTQLGTSAQVLVTWSARPDYDGDTAGLYRFTAQPEAAYTLAPGVTPPEISVRVGESGIMAAAFGDYHADDIAFMNRLIAEKRLNLTQFTSTMPAPPSDWNSIVGWNTSTPMRMESLNLSSLNMTGTLDVGGLDELELLDVSGNALTALNVSNLPQLVELKCGGNLLTSLDISGVAGLVSLYCSGNQLTALNVSSNTNLSDLDCSGNQLASLDTSGNTNLQALSCENNRLEKLTVGSGLIFLDCSVNRLSTLDLSGTGITLTAHLTGQTVNLDLAGSSTPTASYSAEISLNNPTFLPATGLGYSSGILTSTDKTVTSTGFRADTDHPGGATLEGVMHFTYLDNYTVTVNGGSGGGTHAETRTVTITANPAPAGQRFKEWIVEAGNINLEDPTADETTFTMPSANVVVTATYEDGYLVTVNGGTGGDWYFPGDTVNVTAGSPPSGERFKEWVVDSGGVTLANPAAASTTFRMPANAVELTATYEPIPANHYSITVQTDGNGTANADRSSATPGTTITLTATPDTGYRFKEWQVVSGGMAIAGGRFTMPAANVVVKALFEQIPSTAAYTITFDPAGGTVSPTSMRTGADGRLSGLPTPTRSGYAFAGWYTAMSGSAQVTTGYVFTADATVYARWTYQGGSSGSQGSSGGGSSTPDRVTAKTQIPASAFSWDGDRTLTIDYDSITAMGLLSVQWDGTALTRTAEYRVYEGSVIVRFDAEFIAKQSPGNHTVQVEFLNHYGETTATVGDTGLTTGEANNDLFDNDTYNPNTGGYPDGSHPGADNPNTGDGRGIWPALLMGSLGAAALVKLRPRLRAK